MQWVQKNKLRKTVTIICVAVAAIISIMAVAYPFGGEPHKTDDSVVAVSQNWQKNTVLTRQQLPNAHIIDFEIIYQLPELINGCKVTSLNMVLRHLGYTIDKGELASEYLPRVDFHLENDLWVGADPEEAYPGDPYSYDGYYCYPHVVVETANAYLSEQNAPHKAYDMSGIDQYGIMRLLAQGVPIIVWGTVDNESLWQMDVAWHLPDGELYNAYGNMHVYVLVGYDAELFYVADPLGVRDTIAIDTFWNLFAEGGSRAVIVC